MFVQAGHDCWRVPDAGLGGEDDDEISVYAQSKSAVLVTDDRALIARRKANLFGKTVEIAVAVHVEPLCGGSHC